MNQAMIYITTYLSLCLALYNIVLLWQDAKWHTLPKANYLSNKIKLFLLMSVLTFITYISIIIVLNTKAFVAAASFPISIDISICLTITLAALCIVTALILYISLESHSLIKALGNHYHLTLKLFSGIRRSQLTYPIFVSERGNSVDNIEVHADEIHCLTHLFGHLAASNVVHQNNIQIFHSSTQGVPDYGQPIAYAVIGSPINNPRSRAVNASVQKYRSEWQLGYTFNQTSDGDCYLKSVYDDWRPLMPTKHDTDEGRWTDYAIVAKVPNLNSEDRCPILILAGCKAGGSYAISKYVSDLSLLHGLQIHGKDEKLDISKFFYCVFEVDYTDKRPALPYIHRIIPVAGRNLTV